MEVPQENSLCSYLKEAKLSFLFFYKIREQENTTDPAWGFGTVGGRMMCRKELEGEYGANTVCTCM
jgi:hypothetical protein